MESSSGSERSLLLTCEHGGHRVPAAYRALFRGRARLLASHRGWDRGALWMARALAKGLAVPLFAATWTRLLVDLNRSPHNPAVFSSITRGLTRPDRERLLERYHAPHWTRVRDAVLERNRSGATVVHVAVHSFTPLLGGVRRALDVGLLYDPARSREAALARSWQRDLRRRIPGLRVRRNAPYRGAADGLTTALRRRVGARDYLGFEIELAQAALASRSGRLELARALCGVLTASQRRGS